MKPSKILSQLDRNSKHLIVPSSKKISLAKDFDTALDFDGLSEETAKEALNEGIALLAEYQSKLYAQDKYALLIVLQALDAAGKDGTIKHVMSGLNPQGCQVASFKAPSAEELNHDYLWRCALRLPERGHIGIFNRSYYEEVLVARVHRAVLDKQNLPPELKKNIWKRRFKEINNFENYLVDNGIVVLKLFLNVSKAEQKRRFLQRIDEADKNWKFSINDVNERNYWSKYQKAYEDCFNHTSTKKAPWHIIPADNKPYARLMVGFLIYKTLKNLKLSYPTLTSEQMENLLKAKKRLESEG